MAIFKTPAELRKFELSTGETVDLIALIGVDTPEGWAAPAVAPTIGTVAYVEAMGSMRRGVVVKTTKTKVHVAVTTQGAVDAAATHEAYSGIARGSQPVRVQVCIADTNWVRVAPPAARVAQDKAWSERVSDKTFRSPICFRDDAERALVEDDHAEAIRENYQRDQVVAAGGTWATHLMKFDGTVLLRELTLDSQDGKVVLNDNEGGDMGTEFALTETQIEENAAENEALVLADAEAARAENEAPGGIYGPEATPAAEEMDEPSATAQTAAVRETTGSAVVKLLEQVHERIRQNHPEVPAVVIVTGAGTGPGSNKWGHFRPNGWTAGGTSPIHEMFMAGETLAKGSKQVLQTMLHESAHALAETRGKQDTSRQGRWHNKVFLETAREMGLEHRSDKADKAHGYSFVTLTEATLAEYKDLLAELDREIHLMVKLPSWLGGEAGENGGEGIGKKPQGDGGSTGSNLKLTCLCHEPNIIRASKKVAEKLVVRCEDCESTFKER